MRSIFYVIGLLVFTGFIIPSLAQTVSISDPGLNAAIRDALLKPAGPLTEQDLLSLINLSASGRGISSVDGLEAAHNLRILDLDNNSLTNFTIASALTNLTILDLFKNQLASFVLSNALPKLAILDLGFNSLARCSLPAGMTNLDTLFLEGNVLTNFILPAGLTGLTQLDLSANALTRFTVPADMTNLSFVDISGNQLPNLILPAGLSRLSFLRIASNRLTSLTLPPDMTNLTALILDDNPLTTLVLSEPLAATNLADTVAALRDQGVAVSTYPLTIQLTEPRLTANGAFVSALIGPPGVYTLLGSVDLAVWSELEVLTNQVGFARFSEPPPLSPQKFFRVRVFP